MLEEREQVIPKASTANSAARIQHSPALHGTDGLLPKEGEIFREEILEREIQSHFAKNQFSCAIWPPGSGPPGCNAPCHPTQRDIFLSVSSCPH